MFTPSQSLRQWQRKMAALLQQQRERGGVIDGTEKDDVIDLTWVSSGTDSRRQCRNMEWLDALYKCLKF